jgi:hypothetical protein
MKAKPKSQNPAFPDAHPTAPGGMSEKALVKELIERHGYDQRSVNQMNWPAKIEAVANARREEELSRPAVSVAADMFDALDEENEHEAEREMAQAPDDEEEDMFDDLLDEDDEPDESATSSTIDVPYTDAEVEALPVLAEHWSTPLSDDLPGMWEEADLSGGEADTADMFSEDFDPEALLADIEAEQAAAPRMLTKIPGVLDYIFDGHMGAGPSASERWMNCTASLGASRTFLETLSPNQQELFAHSNEAARQGTTAHAAAEVEARLLLGEATQEEVDNTLLELSVVPESEGEAYDDSMAEYIEEYLDLVRSYTQERGNENILIEQRVTAVIPLAGLHDGEVYEITGSTDFAALPAEGETDLVVGDLKYGNGIDVDVESNPQIRIYALGLLGMLVDEEGNLTAPIETLTYHIIQPRLGGIKTWTEPLEDLLNWRDEALGPRLTEALFGAAEGATYVPGEEQCQFCPNRGNCAALAEERIAQASELFDVIQAAEFESGEVGTFPETGSLSDERLGSLLSQVQNLAKLATDLKDEAQRRLHRGGQVPGYHLVNYQPPRHWDDDVEDRLRPDAHDDEGAVLSRKQREMLWKTEPKLLSPTQALALFKAEKVDVEKDLAPLIVTPKKRPVIASVNDRRKAWTGVPPEQMFADESDTEA